MFREGMEWSATVRACLILIIEQLLSLPVNRPILHQTSVPSRKFRLRETSKTLRRSWTSPESSRSRHYILPTYGIFLRRLCEPYPHKECIS
jgi:hypothetical protein